MVNDPSKIQPESEETELKSDPIEMSKEESLLISAHTIKHSVDLEKWNSTFLNLQNEIQIRHYTPKTLRSYSHWVKKFSAYVQKKSSHLTVEDVKPFLSWLAVHQKVSSSSQNQAFNALLFFYRHVLRLEFGKINDIPRAKRKPYIPVVLSRPEIDLVLNKLRQPYRLFVQLLYGCGLRLNECLNLRLQDLNIDH